MFVFIDVREAEVHNLQRFTFFVKKQVFRLEIPVGYLFTV